MNEAENRPGAGIAFVIAGMVAISVNDMLIKEMSGVYPLHQMVFIRSGIGILFSLILVQFEGGWRILRTRRPGLHVLRGLLVVIANMTYFVALSVLPLAEASALFYVAPLFITLLSIPVLGEQVGPLRMGAVLLGFGGVFLMQRPWEGTGELPVARYVLMLPVIAAGAYAAMQVMTRKLGATTKASALAVYIQGMFLVVSAGFYIVAGDGRYADSFQAPHMQFLLRAWVWPTSGDWPWLIGLGLNSAVIGYCLSAAYRLADAATIAPFEYVLLPLAVFWGWMLWGELPAAAVWAGMSLIAGAGIFVFLRERQKSGRVAQIRQR